MFLIARILIIKKLDNRHTLCNRFGKGIARVGPYGLQNLLTFKGFPAFGWHKVIDNFVRLVVLHRKNYILKNWAEKITGTQQEYSPLNF